MSKITLSIAMMKYNVNFIKQLYLKYWQRFRPLFKDQGLTIVNIEVEIEILVSIYDFIALLKPPFLPW